MQFSNEVEDILTLLALTILADKRVFAKEVEAFLEAACSVQADLGMMPSLTNSKLLIWFEINRENFKYLLEKPEFDKALIGLFTRLDVLPNKQPLLDRMASISASDDELHVSEKALMFLAARHWKLPTPRWKHAG